MSRDPITPNTRHVLLALLPILPRRQRNQSELRAKRLIRYLITRDLAPCKTVFTRNRVRRQLRIPKRDYKNHIRTFIANNQLPDNQ